MPNWAQTNYIITGDREVLRTISNTCRDFMKRRRKPLMVKGYMTDPDWEGNIVAAFGGSTDIDLRGFINDVHMNRSGDELYIDALEAWSDSDFRRALKRIFGDKIDIIYRCSEPGSEYFRTNDAEGVRFKRYAVEGFDAYIDAAEFTTQKQALEYISGAIGENISSLKQLEDWNGRQADWYRRIDLHIFKYSE